MRPVVGICTLASAAVAAGVMLKRRHDKSKRQVVPEYDDETVEKALANFKSEELSYHLDVKGGIFKVIVSERKGMKTVVQLDDYFYSNDSKKNSNNSKGEKKIKDEEGRDTPVPSYLNKPYAELGKQYECVDFSSFDLLNLSTNKSVKEAAAMGLGKYGPGACGPRGFYGSLDIFIKFEEMLAEYLKFQECALYSYELLLFPSVIPTLITRKRQPVILPVINHITKKGGKIVNSYKTTIPSTIRNGCRLGYGTMVEVPIDIEINLDDLNTVSINLKELEAICAENPRCWVVLEAGKNGITFSVLEDIHKKVRENDCWLCADCTYLKETYIGAERSSRLPVDAALVGLSTGFGGVGGAVLSTNDVVDRQRLGGRAYVFSAAPPPPAVCGMIESVNVLDQGNVPAVITELAASCKDFVNAISRSKNCYIIDYTEGSPLITIGLQNNYRPDVGLRQICEELMMQGYLVNPSDYEKRELLICIKAGMTTQQIDGFIASFDVIKGK